MKITHLEDTQDELWGQLAEMSNKETELVEKMKFLQETVIVLIAAFTLS